MGFIGFFVKCVFSRRHVTLSLTERSIAGLFTSRSTTSSLLRNHPRTKHLTCYRDKQRRTFWRISVVRRLLLSILAARARLVCVFAVTCCLAAGLLACVLNVAAVIALLTIAAVQTVHLTTLGFRSSSARAGAYITHRCWQSKFTRAEAQLKDAAHQTHDSAACGHGKERKGSTGFESHAYESSR